ncbi:MAG: tetraacyldisaccharide 4'-kinase [Gammaproteobacteria bacterium]
MNRLTGFLQQLWYEQSVWAWLLAPLGYAYQAGMALRDGCYRSGILAMHPVGVPVIVVGNLSVGGTGKTPLVLWLAAYLTERGFKPGIVSRGYGGGDLNRPQQVRVDSDPALVGDEAVLMARRSGCPVAVCRKRQLAARGLVEHAGCNIIISDDGLQHLALARDIEIVVIDGQRRFGNGLCLPAGPLREGLGRLRHVHILVCNGRGQRGEHEMQYQQQQLRPLFGDEATESLADWQGKRVHAVAGIGNPQRFFLSLKQHGLLVVPHARADHHDFTAADFNFDEDLPIIMTEKDAVKCARLSTVPALQNAWYLPVTASLAKTFEYRLNHLLDELRT